MNLKSKYEVQHHQVIESALNNFNADFLCKNNILFGGGTRIALEISEYRESVDIDFLCPDVASYRAVREEVDNLSLGNIVNHQFNYIDEIRFDRYGVRAFVKHEGTRIKIEIVSFERYNLSIEKSGLFSVPAIDRESCFYTKLLANTDRCLNPPYKDIFDILAMDYAWGGVSETSVKSACQLYGNSVLRCLIKSITDIQNNKSKYKQIAGNLKMKPEYIDRLIDIQPSELLQRIELFSV